MTSDHHAEIIEVLDCDIEARPMAAPGVDRLITYVQGVSREPGALLVDFEERVADTLEAFVEAERVCCAGIGWQIERGPGLRLRISAEDAQLTAIESLWYQR